MSTRRWSSEGTRATTGVVDLTQAVRLALEIKASKGLCQGRLLLEGLRLNRSAACARIAFDGVLFAPEFFDDGCADLVEGLAEQGVPAFRLQRKLFSRISYKAEGVLGIVRYATPRAPELDVGRAPRMLVLDGLSDPGNIGGIIRSANALQATAVLVIDSGRRLYHPKALRASMGALFHTPTCLATRHAVLDLARRLEVPFVALTPAGGVSLSELPLGRGFIVVLGNEKRGLDPSWSGVGHRGAIPMLGFVDSLNVTTAASLALYEALRQRQQPDRRPLPGGRGGNTDAEGRAQSVAAAATP